MISDHLAEDHDERRKNATNNDEVSIVLSSKDCRLGRYPLCLETLVVFRISHLSVGLGDLP